MTTPGADRADWLTSLERALAPLVQSATAERDHASLTNAEYLELGRRADRDDQVRAIFDKCPITVRGNLTAAEDLLAQHPSIRRNSEVVGSDLMVGVVKPYSRHTIRPSALLLTLVRSAVKRGTHCAVKHLDNFLHLNTEGQVPGYEVTEFRGLSMAGAANVTPDLEIVSYECATKRRIVSDVNSVKEPGGLPHPREDRLVISRKLTWAPCLMPPTKSRDYSWDPSVKFHSASTPGARIALELLSIIVPHRIRALPPLYCAPDFEDAVWELGARTSLAYSDIDRRDSKQLTQEHVRHLKQWLQAWSQFDTEKRHTLELAVSRLTSAIWRESGTFPLQDRILDETIALEIMYGLSSNELTFKLAARAGHLLAEDTDERLAIYDRVVSLYTARSSIVHGDMRRKRKRRGTLDLHTIAHSGFDLARQTLSRLLKQGEFPDWKKLIMS